MLASNARAVPAIGRRSESAVENCTWPFSIATSTPCGLARFNVPFGPFTLTLSALMVHSTPFGRAIGFLATRDIEFSLGNQADDFAANAFSAGLAVGHD